MKEKNQNKEQNTNQNQEQNQNTTQRGACIRMGRGRHEAVPFPRFFLQIFSCIFRRGFI